MWLSFWSSSSVRVTGASAPRPRIRRSSSLRLPLCPMPRISSASVAICAPSALARGGLGHDPAGGLDRLDDVHVAGAAADVPRDRPADVVVTRRRVLLEQRLADEHHPRGAEPALQAVLLLERRLDRVESARGGQAPAR